MDDHSVFKVRDQLLQKCLVPYGWETDDDYPCPFYGFSDVIGNYIDLPETLPLEAVEAFLSAAEPDLPVFPDAAKSKEKIGKFIFISEFFSAAAYF